MNNLFFSLESWLLNILIAQIKSLLHWKGRNKSLELSQQLAKCTFGVKKQEFLSTLMPVFPDNGKMEDFISRILSTFHPNKRLLISQLNKTFYALYWFQKLVNIMWSNKLNIGTTSLAV